MERVLAAKAFVRRLYDFEDEAESLSSAERLHLPREKSVSVLESFRQWLLAQQPQVLAGRRRCCSASRLRASSWASAPSTNLRDVLAKLPTQPAERLDELLPHRWQAARTPKSS